MEKYDVSTHGFEGCLYEPENNDGEKCLIVNLMFAPESFLLKKFVRTLNEAGVSALTLGSWGTRQTVPDENLVPLDYLLAACDRLKKKGYRKIGTIGLSMTAVMGLYGAAICPDLTLTIAISGYDMLFEGVLGRGSQYPSGHSTLTLKGEELPYQPFYLDKQEYQQAMKTAKKVHGENYGRDLWENAKKILLHEEALIPVEDIQGQILFLCARHDTCWDSHGAAKRMEERIREMNGSASVTCKSFTHATHMLYPAEVPFINLLTRLAFKEAKQNPKACGEARRQVSKMILQAVHAW